MNDLVNSLILWTNREKLLPGSFNREFLIGYQKAQQEVKDIILQCLLQENQNDRDGK